MSIGVCRVLFIVRMKEREVIRLPLARLHIRSPGHPFVKTYNNFRERSAIVINFATVHGGQAWQVTPDFGQTFLTFGKCV